MGKLSGKPVTPLYLKSSMPTYMKRLYCSFSLMMISKYSIGRFGNKFKLSGKFFSLNAAHKMHETV